MSQISKDSHYEGALIEQETRKIDESCVLQKEVQPEELRKGERARTLTEKGREFQREKTKGLLLRFDSIYERWKALTKLAKKSVTRQDPSNILQENINTIQRELSELNNVYDEYRRMDSPAHEMRRKLDNCTSVTKVVVQNAQSQIQGIEEELIWPDASSVFASTTSSVSSPNSKCSRAISNRSNASSIKRQEAAAEYAATQAVLKIMAEQDCQQEKLQRLEVEDRLIVADQEAAARTRRLQQEREETERKIEKEKQEATLLKKQQEENAERKKSVEDLKRELERLEELKRLNAARARLQIYDEDTFQPEQELTSCRFELPMPEQAINQENPVNPQRQPLGEVAPSSILQNETGELVKVLAEAISANRLPIPEPTIFSGDPLKFNHWKSSFQTLVERKNIPTTEKIFFLQKYVGGAAREALEGYFLIDSEHSYCAAWNLLNERYGDPFVIAKAFRDKLHAWPKLASRESAELRRFVDFLRSCEAAIVHIESLKVLNDDIENQRLTAKLPDWLSTRWNRRATQYQMEHRRFPSFNYFVTFLTMEANIACNPITSYHALQQSQPDKAKIKSQTIVATKAQSAKIFTTNASERTIPTCVFCKKLGHSLHKCHRFVETPVADRVKFIQSERLCFGCLCPGHQSKSCSSRLACDTCSKRHPTCLHEDRSKQEQRRESSKEMSCSNERKPQSTQRQDNIKESTSNRVVQDVNIQSRSQGAPIDKKRSAIYANFSEVKQYQLHHFSDASVTG
ncbi:uncharacterized protein LOC134105270 [Pungitius pungitius]|uniref:uncharacterized protein LOC134105270 n=1 Tax=Pungitius pungitius TaxID=134920 RepID=UPI002E118ABE